MRPGELYDAIGSGYGGARREDPRLAGLIWGALGDARTVLNVGAGSGSYEPRDRTVVAVEPSAVMRAQRPVDAAPCVAASAEALPFDDNAFDVVMTVLSDHHWSDYASGLRECARVGRRVVLFNWDNEEAGRFWLTTEYAPEFLWYSSRGPSLGERARRFLAGDATLTPVPIPWDCEDAFFHAYWRRPEMYLSDDVRAATSVWRKLPEDVEPRAVAALRADLESGAWAERHADLLDRDALDVGARLVIAETA